MKDVSAYIRELLFSHDCVILPDFGGFIGNYIPARIDNSSHTFSPPVKAISFNRNLKHNDGLLIARISERLKIAYVDAKRILDDYIIELKKKIDNGERFHIDGIGYFQNNKEGNIQFEPDSDSNYLLDSYGLSSFNRLPVEDYDVSKTVIRRHDKDPLVLANRRKMVWRTVIAVPFIAAMIIVPLKTDMFRSDASLNPLAKTQFEEIKSTDQAELVITKLNEARVSDPVIENEIVSEPEETTKGFIDNEEGLSDKEVIVKSTKGEGIYFLVAGSFKDQANAIGFFNDVSLKGFEAEIIKSNNAYYKVSLESYGAKNEAVKERDILQKDFQDIWIWKK